MSQPQIEPRSRLVTKEEMGKGFAKLTHPNELMDLGFYSQLAQYAGFEAGPQELAFLITQALEKRSSAGSRFSLSQIIDVMVGEQGRVLGNATKKIFENIAAVAEETLNQIRAAQR
jgi:hypothetical protein